jgi:hypothetical protein
MMENSKIPDEMIVGLLIIDLQDAVETQLGHSVSLPELIGGLIICSCGVENLDAIAKSCDSAHERLKALETSS